MRTYNTLFARTCKLHRNEGNDISREDYADLAEDDHFNLVRHGSVRLTLKFSEALT